MISETLRKARWQEAETEKKIAAKDRPEFHLSARAGWMNDPNGFSYYNGQYHMFYQYYPNETKWGPMHWGHAVSEDLLRWTYMPAALAPDTTYDGDGCFSGSACALPDGRHMLMYTGVRRELCADGIPRDVQTQCLAFGDGQEYVKYELNPILDETHIPEGSSRHDFRDPKVWQNEDGSYDCVIGGRLADGRGRILLYHSEDGLNWTFKNILVENDGRFGLMWECPDFFELDGKWVLITSPQDMLSDGGEYDNGNGTLCLTGEFDRDKGIFSEESDQSIDQGIDFYAPQTILTEDGRRIMIGWMQNWDSCTICPHERKWFGQMSVPRELFIKNGRLCQRPIRELDMLRKGCARYEHVDCSQEVRLPEVKGRSLDLDICLRAANEQEGYRSFAMRFAADEKRYSEIRFNPDTSELTVDRSRSGTRRALLHTKTTRVTARDGELRLRVILDRFSAEVFVNDGEQVMSMTLYTDQSADDIYFIGEGNVEMDLVKYDLSGSGA